ncbi:MAG: tetratricopeptide repeat protein [Candidatus Omnitrophica bacterium]|nr:tetratricopeptide repeat protein [Candidatus Omnitrophota bacterium]
MSDQPAKPRISLLHRIFLILFGICLALIILEAGLRLGGFIILSLQEYRNQQSLKHKGTYRILCIGESTTQSEYPQFLEEALNQRKGGVTFSVINKGLGGTNSSAILDSINQYLSIYHPDMVVAMMGINDGAAHMPFEPETFSKTILFMRSLKVYKLARLIWLHINAKYQTMHSSHRQTYARISCRESSALRDNSEKYAAAPGRGPDYYADLGETYLLQGKYSLAEETLRQGIALNPNDSRFYVGLGEAYILQGKYSLAKEALKQGIAADPGNPICYADLGRRYKAEGKYSLAEETFKQGIAADPGNPICYADLGRLYQLQGKYSLAEELFKQGIALNPNDDRMYGSLALLYQEEGQEALANEYYRKAYELRTGGFNPVTASNYHRLRKILDKRNVKLICVQYPMRSIAPLMKIFEDDASGIIFVDNEKIFKEAVQKEGYRVYFRDMFGGDFGHCTDKGNRLLAGNISDAIFKEVFGR